MDDAAKMLLCGGIGLLAGMGVFWAGCWCGWKLGRQENPSLLGEPKVDPVKFEPPVDVDARPEVLPFIGGRNDGE